MPVKNINVHELINRLKVYLSENDLTKKYANEELPFRAELFNADQLQHHGIYLAKIHKIAEGRKQERLLKRLSKNEKILFEVRDLLTESAKEKRLIAPAGEWLLDNFYLIEDNINTGKKHLPRGYSESLPRLSNTVSAGFPRVYDIALELISHTDGRIDNESLHVFIKAYQSITSLQLGELWALPIMLRLALIENLRRLSVRVAMDNVNQGLADYWASLMIDTAERDPKSLILVIADMARSNPPMESAFVAELMRQLIWKGSSLSLPLTWMEQRLSENNITTNELVSKESQKKAADQVAVSNSIGSLRFLNSIDWQDFVEEMSVVEHILQKDPAEVYAAMDFATRDSYRHSIERLAKYSKRPEYEVADMIVSLANEKAPNAERDEVNRHVGFYLIGEGRKEIEKKIVQKLPWRRQFQKTLKHHPLTFYLTAIALVSVVVAGYMCLEGYREGVNIWVLAATAIVFLLGASHLASVIVNWLATLVIEPELLPRLDFSYGVPDEFTTMVIVPTMLSNPKQAETLLETLEVRFLANKDNNLYFGLLTDFLDANAEILPGDGQILQLVKSRIEELNNKYPGYKFFLFHRPRKWNPYDKIWMGYERKRGKLTQLNALIKGGPTDEFSLIVGDMDALPNVKYIITLDTDTQLPRDAAWKLVGTMAHPLNRPYYDDKKQRITKGYGILQPLPAVSLSRSAPSIYARINGTEPGIDPYSRLISDVYQDLFHEGSFIGKGIYDIDAFERAIKGRFPENRILSHDLLEGCFARSGLLSDVQFYEEYPAHYSNDVNRRHRWIRGDWQIAYWSLPFAPDSKRSIRKNPLSPLSRWKIFDNLRRSMTPVALTVILLLGWTVFHASWFWTVSVLLIIMIPSLITSVWSIFKKAKDTTFRQHITSSISLVADSLFHDAFMFICLPYEAFYTVDAICRTVWRMLITQKKLLEWHASHNLEIKDRTLLGTYYSMWFSPILAAVVLIYMSAYTPIRLIVAAPVLIGWALAPLVAWWISTPTAKHKEKPSQKETNFLRVTARRIWAFFEDFVNEKENWLPPDNYQLRPNNVVASRTSPTNIGLSLLANLCAYDFGYITVARLIDRTSKTMATLDKMERYKGHLYNWYDTITLQPLHPRYVSTVDSGNMANHLLVLRQGLLATPSEKIISLKLFEGLKDTMSIIEKAAARNPAFKEFRKVVDGIIVHRNLTPKIALIALRQLCDYARNWNNSIQAVADGDILWWSNVLVKQCTDMFEELSPLFPWLLLQENTDRFNWLQESINVTTLHEIAALESKLMPDITKWANELTPAEEKVLATLTSSVKSASAYAQSLIADISRLASKCAEFADVDYEFLYDRHMNLLSIGYNVEIHQKDSGYYDLLASEARLCTFTAIAQGKLPQESWFALGRLITDVKNMPALVSWSGSMFEYLMPLLVMPSYENTLLHQTHLAVVTRQIDYATQRNIPWGISESGYNMVDARLNYQYRAFGVPGLGLCRGLSDDLVIAPYACILALMVAPEESYKNLERMMNAGFAGKYGYYEAIDYTPSRVPKGQTHVTIQSYMAHHQGMSLAAIAYALLGQPMQKRFEAELQFRATLLLLQERVPKITAFYTHHADAEVVHSPSNEEKAMRIINTPDTQIPEIQLLSNGRYHVMVTNAGGGYSRWRNIAVTRWREDSTCDNWGTFCYIRNLEDGEFWANTYQPTLKAAKNYEATFTQGKAEFKRRDNNIETRTEVAVSPEDDIEMRRIHITNRSRKRVTLDVTSYSEVVLNSQAADIMHPAFNNLFVQTQIIEQRHAIVCTRRPRSSEERPPYMMHLMTLHGANAEKISYETGRAEFIGRGNTIVNPAALTSKGSLSNRQGAVLDPIVSIRYQFTLQPDETVIIDMVTGATDNRDTCLGLVEKYQEKHHKDRVFELAWTHSQVVLRQINATERDAQLYTQLASSIIYTNPALRADPSIVAKNNRGQAGLWGYSVSGDLPIVLLQIEDIANIELAKQLIQAHAYWRLKGLAVDLVIWNDDHGGYRQSLQNQIQSLVAAGQGAEYADGQLGSIFMRAADQVPNEDRILFQTVARVNISDKKGSLEDNINKKNPGKNTIPYITPKRVLTSPGLPVPVPRDLLFFNGYGGFSPDAKEYVVITGSRKYTPAPWINVLANSEFGTIISESGQSYTWFNNAHEYRLTPWENDPVTDKSGEAFYIRDEESGNFWSPTPLPATGTQPYVTQHGFGYSIFKHAEEGIQSEMTIFVDVDSAVKFFLIKLKNNSGRPRQLSVTGYMELVLGDLKHKNAMHVITEIDAESGALFARNQYSKDFAGYITFFDADDAAGLVTGDRTEFIGRNGSLRRPDALTRAKLSGKVGAALDPCAAIQSAFTLVENQEHEIAFMLGIAANTADATRTVQQFRGQAHSVLERAKSYWMHTLGALQVNTPDGALNILTNGWLQYQTIACRLWARSGYYQSGGAFGFRDQLQDVLAIMHHNAALARKQILLCASRQFVEGDVQHWWHPPLGHGVRTRCSDDLLWLPFVTSVYIAKTGDHDILNENITYIEDRILNVGEESNYSLPTQSGQSGTLYDHCVRAINYGAKYGAHGLALMGSGDWNDGMDNVGRDGKGESVWLSFFLFDTLMRFSVVANAYSDTAFAEKCHAEAEQIRLSIEKNGWDGSWYRRAYFDDGTPLGSAENMECQIDSISQSWAILSGAGSAERTHLALDMADKRLVKRDYNVVQLLDPPFDKAEPNPGYIKGYVPGIRENGGQYTHAAIWMIMAYAKLGNARRAWELLNIINPVNRGGSDKDIATYKVEPYVVAADVYSIAANAGHGGWTWYTGSAGWMYQLVTEWLLGIKLENDRLRFNPCIPDHWESFTITYRYKETTYHITIEQLNDDIETKEGAAPMKVILDGSEQEDDAIILNNDKAAHHVQVLMYLSNVNQEI